MISMCNYIDSEHVMPGWMCCKCHAYNDMSREQCKHCQQSRCSLLSPDVVTGRGAGRQTESDCFELLATWHADHH